MAALSETYLLLSPVCVCVRARASLRFEVRRPIRLPRFTRLTRDPPSAVLLFRRASTCVYPYFFSLRTGSHFISFAIYRRALFSVSFGFVVVVAVVVVLTIGVRLCRFVRLVPNRLNGVQFFSPMPRFA